MKLLTDEEIEVEVNQVASIDTILNKYERDRKDEASSLLGSNLLWAHTVRRYARKISLNVAKAQAELTREQTLREVGEWLYSLCPHTTDPLQQRKLCQLCVSTLAEELFGGRMP
jgi:hypothetical protein